MSDNIECTECAGPIVFEQVEVGEVVDCPECGVELEVTSTTPITLALAPEEAEDWGE